jgi:hypothetical protein
VECKVSFYRWKIEIILLDGEVSYPKKYSPPAPMRPKHSIQQLFINL